MQVVIWTGIIVLGLITFSTVGTIFLHVVGELRKSGVETTQPEVQFEPRRGHLRKVNLDALRQDRPAERRAA